MTQPPHPQHRDNSTQALCVPNDRRTERSAQHPARRRRAPSGCRFRRSLGRLSKSRRPRVPRSRSRKRGDVYTPPLPCAVTGSSSRRTRSRAPRPRLRPGRPLSGRGRRRCGAARAGSARRAGPGSEPGAVRGAGRRRRAPAAAVPGIFPQAERGVRDNPRGKCFSVIALKCSRSNSLQFPKHCQDHNLSPPDPPRFLQNCRLCSVFGPGRNSDAYHPAPLCSATISYKNPGPYASHPHASMQK